MPHPVVNIIRKEIQSTEISLRPVAVAFSGGADSLALLVALKELIEPERLMALHCNFHLRGEESDAETDFCIATATSLGIPIEVKHFRNVRDEMDSHGESLEMACRRLRYDWFREFSRAGTVIALAHHIEDNRETVMLNLMRGTGIKGLAGMKTFDPHRLLWRPLLSCTKQEIIRFLESKGYKWRTDSSNLLDDVQRNRLRLNVMPIVYENFPKAPAGIDLTISNMNSDSSLLKEYLEQLIDKTFDRDKGVLNLEILKRLTSHPARVLLELLAPLGFNSMQCAAIATVTRGEGYKRFDSGSHTVYCNGITLELTARSRQDQTEDLKVSARTLEELVDKVPELKLEILQGPEAMPLLEKTGRGTSPANKIFLDKEKFINRFEGTELAWRPVKTGDRISPFGMKGRTRLASDILTDCHASPVQKREARVLTADDKILWLAPLRASSFCPLNELTASAYVISFNQTPDNIN